MLDRVLRRHHQERRIKLKRFGSNGDLFLLHRFEQRTLDFGGSPVDLVGKDQIRKDRSFLNDEVLVLRPIDLGSDQVGGQQVGSKLDTLKTGVDGFSQTRNGSGLCQPRHALDQQVPSGQQANQHPVDKLILPDENSTDFVHDLTQRLAGQFDLL